MKLFGNSHEKKINHLVVKQVCKLHNIFSWLTMELQLNSNVNFSDCISCHSFIFKITLGVISPQKYFIFKYNFRKMKFWDVWSGSKFEALVALNTRIWVSRTIEIAEQYQAIILAANLISKANLWGVSAWWRYNSWWLRKRV